MFPLRAYSEGKHAHRPTGGLRLPLAPQAGDATGAAHRGGGPQFSPRPPAFLALNEPETSLHPALLEPLARLIVNASQSSQVWITTHAEPLAEAITRLTRVHPIRLLKAGGETQIEGEEAAGSDEDAAPE